METKIDLTKCNNCRYKATIDGVVTTGYIRAKEGLNAFLYNEDGYRVGYLESGGLVSVTYNPITDFEIVPRDPETYMDWQVGDDIADPEYGDDTGKVIFRCGELAVISDSLGKAIPYTCEELFKQDYRLILTDIEKQIIEETKKSHEFKKGDPVLVRDDGCPWKIGIFCEKREDRHWPYRATDGTGTTGYTYCIPYNDKTMHLLGTTEVYKEE